MPYKAVVFDMGGVVLKYKNHEVYLQAMSKVENDEEHRKQMHHYERGLFSLTEFPQFAARFKHAFERANGDPENVDLEELMGGHDPNIKKAISKLKQSGYKIALLTNNGYWSPVKQRSLLLKDVSDFDLVVESCREGHRKPDPEIYHITTKKLEMKPEECIFVDDILDNVKAAESLGWTAIHLADNNSEEAVKQLEKLLNLEIL